MNSCILMAEIVREPQLRYTSDNQTPVAEMLIQFPGLREEDRPATLTVVGWGNLAQEIQANYHKGDRIVVEGRLGMNRVERQEGFKETRAELTAQKIHNLGTGATISSTAAVASTPAEAAPQPRTQAAKPASKPAATRAVREEAKVPSYAAPAPELADYDDIPF